MGSKGGGIGNSVEKAHPHHQGLLTSSKPGPEFFLSALHLFLQKLTTNMLKRRRPASALRPEQMLDSLANMRLAGLLQHNTIWLAVNPDLAMLLDQCCTGQVHIASYLQPSFAHLSLCLQLDGGPNTAAEVAAILAPVVPATPAPLPTVVPTSLAQTPHLHTQGPFLDLAGKRLSGSCPAVNLETTTRSATPLPLPEGRGAEGGGHENLPSSSDRVGAAPTSGRFGGRGGRGRVGRGSGVQVPCIEGLSLVCVRLTLEESFFLHHVLGCLSVSGLGVAGWGMRVQACSLLS
jgi:hypothetical protein